MKRIENYFPESASIPCSARIHVSNLVSRRSGASVKNQFSIRVGWYEARFQSYETTCLIWDCTSRVLTVFPEAFCYSTTTSKYSRLFLEDVLGWSAETVEEVRKMAKSEDYGRDCPLYIEIPAEVN